MMMQLRVAAGAAALFLITIPARTQPVEVSSGNAPLYRVTVVERTMKAINYEYRAGSTKIDFRGTVLMPGAEGKAEVESKRGRVDVDAKFEHMVSPARFGHEYMTYVLWAITPEGRPHNLGEIVADGSDKAKLHVTTQFQAFGLLVTAEPYSAVTQPSDVVVLENEIRPDTVGTIEEVRAKYELLPRGSYTWQPPVGLYSAVGRIPRYPMDHYEATLQLYEARNAVGIAQAANAGKYAPDTLARAQALLNEAEQLHDSRAGLTRVAQSAREAAQTAEDARVIAQKRQMDETLADANAEAAAAQKAKVRAQAEANAFRAQAQDARVQAEAERAARLRAEDEASAARIRAARAESEAERAKTIVVVQAPPVDPDASRKTALRMALLERMNAALPTRDTPRGLVATIRDSEFAGAAMRPVAVEVAAQVAAIVAGQPGLEVHVEGHADGPAAEAIAYRRAAAVRDALLRRGLSSSIVTAEGMGDSRLLVSNLSPGGRDVNRRVEIVITGYPIGTLATWDRTYTLRAR